ncbi:MAG TPA: hypothetical protein VF614_08130 [Chthoniobacteraceae bacterium]|jgi:hypothetical protein
MSFEAVQQEITTWDAAALRRLIAYAVVLQDRKSGILPEQLAAKLDDKDGSRWVSLDEFDRRAGISEADLGK